MEQSDLRRVSPTCVTPFTERRTVDHEGRPGLARRLGGRGEVTAALGSGR